MSLRQFIQFCVFILTFAALTGCKTSTEVQKNSAEYRLQISSSLIKHGNYPEALKELKLAEKDDPNNPYIQANLGVVYYNRERYELTEKHLLRAIALKPDFTDAKNSLARAYLDTNRLSKAESLLKEAVDDLTYTAYQRTYANLGLLEFKKKNYDKAVEHFKKALEKDRENCDVLTYLGRSYTELEQYATADVQFNKAMTFCAQNDIDEAHYYSAINLYRKNEILRALGRFEELIKIFPDGENADKSRKMIEIIRRGSK